MEREASDEPRPSDEPRHGIPPDASEADVLEQERAWDEEASEPTGSVPLDAPEGDVLDQHREIAPEDDER